MTTASVAIVETIESGRFTYYVTLMQTKILSKDVIENLESVREDIGRLILKRMNIYRKEKGLNELKWSPRAY